MSSPDALRRTDRIAGQGGITREAFEAFTRQERLADAFTLDASLFKSFYFDRSRLTAALMLRNLLGDADTPYGGYESLRVRRIRPGDDTLYTPPWPRATPMRGLVRSILQSLTDSDPLVKKCPIFLDFTVKFVFCKGERTLKLPKP